MLDSLVRQASCGTRTIKLVAIMQALVDRIVELEKEIDKQKEAITELLKPYHISDYEYDNKDVKVTIDWGFEEKWTVYDAKGYISGFGGTTVWLVIWNMLHNIEQEYTELNIPN